MYKYVCFRCGRKFTNRCALGGHRKYCKKLTTVIPDIDKNITLFYLQRLKNLEEKIRELKEKEKKRTVLLNTGEIVEMSDAEYLQYRAKRKV
jgi:hypothetical protein